MPRYLNSGKLSYKSCNTNDSCKDSVRFFTVLAEKLKDMAITINDRIEEIKKNSCQTVPGGIFFASVDVPQMTLGVKYEYIEYITRYGPPDDGIFDPDKLNKIRSELGISESNYTI